MRTISRILGQRTYLVGPIDRCKLDGRHWRQAITPELLDRGIVVFDPLDKPCDDAPEDPESRAQRRLWKSDGDYDRFSNWMKKIVAIDMRLVNTCDFVIAFLDLDVYSCGTFDEIVRADDQKKPVLIWCKQGKEAVPDWLFGKLPHALFFDSMDEVLDYLDRVAFDDEPPPHLNRWIFFDFTKLYPTQVVSQIKLASGGVI